MLSNRLYAVPPDIVDENSTSDLTVHEGDNATLICAAKGLLLC